MGNCGSAATGTVFENIGINSNLRQRVVDRVNRNTINTKQVKKITNQIKIQPSDDFDENKNNPLYRTMIRLYKDPAWWQFWKSPEPCSDPLPLFACTYDVTQSSDVKLSSFTQFTNATVEEIYNDVKQEMIKNNDSDVSGIQNSDLSSALNKAKSGSTKLIQNLLDKIGDQTSEEGTSTIINYSYPIRCNINKDDCSLDNPKITQDIQSEIVSNEILNIITSQILKADVDMKSKLEKKTDTKNNTCIYITGSIFIVLLIALFFIAKTLISGGGNSSGGGIIYGGKRFKNIINSKNKPIFLIIIIISILYIHGICN
jgi:hypothetical protein